MGEFSGYVAMVENGMRGLGRFCQLYELAQGARRSAPALTPKWLCRKFADEVAAYTKLPFITAPNKFEALATHDAMVEAHAAQ